MMNEIFDVFPNSADDIHVSTHAHSITAFIDVDKQNMVCFRCGETGHVRYQCLTFRVRLCPNFERGECKDTMCTYAHGKDQLRTPWKSRCVRVIKQGGNLVCIGCNSVDHTFRKCPHHQDVLLI